MALRRRSQSWPPAARHPGQAREGPNVILSVRVADSLRFWALRMRDVGAIKSSPQKIIEASMDLRFLNELKKELKA